MEYTGFDPGAAREGVLLYTASDFGYSAPMIQMKYMSLFYVSLALGCTAQNPEETGLDVQGDPFADVVVSFSPGNNAGFGQDEYPDVVLGPPQGKGPNAGSLHVLSLGEEGEIVLGFDDVPIIDGPGVDVLVFENPFPGWPELGIVSVSEDGDTWFEWPCESTNSEEQYPGCAGFNPVLSHPDNDISPTDPQTAGGEGYDLAELGLTEAWFIRITDAGVNGYEGVSGGFDLDAVAVVHWEDAAQ